MGSGNVLCFTCVVSINGNGRKSTNCEVVEGEEEERGRGEGEGEGEEEGYCVGTCVGAWAVLLVGSSSLL